MPKSQKNCVHQMQDYLKLTINFNVIKNGRNYVVSLTMNSVLIQDLTEFYVKWLSIKMEVANFRLSVRRLWVKHFKHAIIHVVL